MLAKCAMLKVDVCALAMIRRDVTNEAAQLVWRLVMAEGGEIAWELDDGSRMVLKAEKQEATSEQD